jgi:iron-sulfur cluster repair protein YtfE (RIC family)
MTVNQVLQQYPATLPVFNRYRVDACCGRVAPLAVAAAVPVEELLAALEAAAQRTAW